MIYPLVPQSLIVGIDAGKARQFAPVEVLALLEAFHAHTGFDPLADGVKLDEILQACRRGQNDSLGSFSKNPVPDSRPPGRHCTGS